jgi:signal transduction histidine kinase
MHLDSRNLTHALRNAFRHAEASELETDIRYDQRQFWLRVRDDGKGIDAAVLDAGGREGHFGLRGMRERADLIGGKLRIWSSLEVGTEIELTVPAVRAYRAPPSTGSGLLAKLGRQAVNDES